jgi:hypothetical protein
MRRLSLIRTVAVAGLAVLAVPALATTGIPAPALHCAADCVPPLRHLPLAPLPATSPLPEPEMWTLLILALGGMGAAWRFGNPHGSKRR